MMPISARLFEHLSFDLPALVAAGLIEAAGNGRYRLLCPWAELEKRGVRQIREIEQCPLNPHDTFVKFQ
jgi:hypothetical protein